MNKQPEPDQDDDEEKRIAEASAILAAGFDDLYVAMGSLMINGRETPRSQMILEVKNQDRAEFWFKKSMLKQRNGGHEIDSTGKEVTSNIVITPLSQCSPGAGSYAPKDVKAYLLENIGELHLAMGSLKVNGKSEPFEQYVIKSVNNEHPSQLFMGMLTTKYNNDHDTDLLVSDVSCAGYILDLVDALLTRFACKETMPLRTVFE